MRYKRFAMSVTVSGFRIFFWVFLVSMIAGIRVSLVIGDSMLPTVKSGSLAVTVPVGAMAATSLKIGDMVTAKIAESVDGTTEPVAVWTIVVIKRIVHIAKLPYGTWFYLKGDNTENTWEGWVGYADVWGKAAIITNGWRKTMALMVVLVLWAVLASILQGRLNRR